MTKLGDWIVPYPHGIHVPAADAWIDPSTPQPRAQITAMASAWMRVRQRAVQRGVELPLILSDHANWDELADTPREVGVTHGREDALVRWSMTRQIKARALALRGYEDEDD